MSTHRPNLWAILSETSRIISADRRHFLALSVFFLLPISSSTILYPFLSQSTSVHSHYLRSVFLMEISPVGKSQLLFPILYALFLLLFSLCATASITFTTFHGFHHRPVSFISSLKSVLVSFFPLLATLIITQIILGLIVFAFGVFMLLAYNVLALLGFEMDYDDDSFLVFVISIAALLIGLLVFLQVQWCLSSAVVVVESRWGLSPLKRSCYLVKGVRGVVFSMTLLFGVLVGLLSIWCSNFSGNAGGWISWGIVLQMVVYAGFLTVLSLYTVAANTVLFVYCKGLHGELAVRTDEEFGREYVRLPSDEGVVVPCVVNVVSLRNEGRG